MSRTAPRWVRSISTLAIAVACLACAPSAAPAARSAPPAGNAPAGPAAPQAPAAAPTAARAPIHWAIGIPVAPPGLVHIVPYVAMEQGFYQEVGLEPELTNFDGGTQALRSSLSGTGIDVAGTSSDPVISAVSRGATVKAIGSYASRLSVVMMGQPGINSAADLRGKNMGVPGQAQGFSDVMSRTVLATAGLKPDDAASYRFISTGARVSALVAGQVDTSVLHIDQYYKALEQKPDLSLVAKMWELLPNWWYSAFMATEQSLVERPEAYVAFEQASIKASRFIYENRDRTVEIAVKHTGNTREPLERAYDDLVKGGAFAVNDGLPRDAIEETIQRQVEMGMVEGGRRPTYDLLVDRRFADEAVRRLGGPWTGDPRWQ